MHSNANKHTSKPANPAYLYGLNIGGQSYIPSHFLANFHSWIPFVLFDWWPNSSLFESLNQIPITTSWDYFGLNLRWWFIELGMCLQWGQLIKCNTHVLTRVMYFNTFRCTLPPVKLLLNNNIKSIQILFFLYILNIYK